MQSELIDLIVDIGLGRKILQHTMDLTKNIEKLMQIIDLEAINNTILLNNFYDQVQFNM